MARTDEEIFQLWKGCLAEVTRLVAAVEADPSQAPVLGLNVTPETDFRGFAEPARIALMRSAARKIIPEAFEWEVLPTVGGACYLALKSYRPERE